MENIIDRLNKADRIIQQDEFDQVDFIRSLIQNEVERGYLFNAVSAHYSPSWFLLLFDQNAFDFQNIPEPVEEVSDNGAINYALRGWDASILIRMVAERNAKDYNDEVGAALMRLIDKYIDYTREWKEGEPRNTRPDWFMCESILFLQLEAITQKHLAFIEAFGIGRGFGDVSHELVGVFFQRIVEAKDKRLLFDLLDLLYKSSDLQTDNFNLHSKIDTYYLKEFVNSSAESLISNFGTIVIDWFARKITGLYHQKPVAFSKFNITAIGEDRQNWQTETLGFLITKNLRNCLSLPQLDLGYLATVCKTFLKGEVPVLNRLAFYVINLHYSPFHPLFWELKNPLQNNETKLEVFKLVDDHAREFSEDNVEQFVRWVEEESHDSEDERDLQIKRQAFKKLEWYMALKNLPEELKTTVETKKEDLLKITESEPTHAGYDSWFEVGPAGDYSAKRIIDEDINQVAERIQNPDSWGGYDQWGLEQDIRTLVITRTEEVIQYLPSFLGLKFSLLYYFFDGFREIVSRNHSINWMQVLDFTGSLLKSRDDLWDLTEEKSQSSNLLGMIAWFIREGVKEKGAPLISNETVQPLIDILSSIDRNYKKQFSYLNVEKSFDVINSTRGKLFEAFLTLSLSLVDENKKINRWDPRLREIFTKRLYDHSYLDEFYWVLGFYTPQIGYLDKKWLEENKRAIYLKNERIEDYAFKGYLEYSSRLYSDLFEILKQFYERAIDLQKEEGEYPRRMIEHLLVGYETNLPGSESLLDRVFQTGKLFYLKQIVESIDSRFVFLGDEKLVSIWSRVVSSCENSKQEAAKVICYASSEFIEYVTSLDEKVMALFRKAIGYYQTDPRIYRLIDNLSKLMSRQSKEGAILLRDLIKKSGGDFASFNRNLVAALQQVYQNGWKEIGDDLCLYLVARGNYFAKDVYNEYNSVTSFDQL